MNKEIESPRDDPPEPLAYRRQALELLERQKTMVLAVSEDDQPWVAPVYFVFRPPGLFFFSSPRSRHIQALEGCRHCAGAIYADCDRWENIKGLQMVGHVREVEDRSKRLKITASYLVKFPMAFQLLASGKEKTADLKSRVHLYGFWPIEIHCTSNTLGFGRRVKIQL